MFDMAGFLDVSRFVESHDLAMKLSWNEVDLSNFVTVVFVVFIEGDLRKNLHIFVWFEITLYTLIISYSFVPLSYSSFDVLQLSLLGFCILQIVLENHCEWT